MKTFLNTSYIIILLSGILSEFCKLSNTVFYTHFNIEKSLMLSVYSYGALIVAWFGRRFAKIDYKSWVKIFIVGVIGIVIHITMPKFYESYSVFDNSFCIYMLFKCVFHYIDKSREELSEQ